MTTIIGGSKFIIGDKTSYGYSRLKVIYRDTGKLDLNFNPAGMSYNDLVKNLVQHFELSRVCIHAMARLHELIARHYTTIIDLWVSNNPEFVKKINFKESETPRPPNYTPAMTRLKNMTWSKYSAEDIKGFCPYEPIVRLMQLAKYPITKFATISTSNGLPEIPTPPKVPTGHVRKNADDKDIYITILELRDTVQEFENFYTKICHIVELVSDRLQKKVDLT